MTQRNIVLAMLSVLLSVTMIFAQDECTTIVADALTATDAACTGIGRNEACFGNVNITTTLADTTLIFQSQGDVVDLTEIERMTLSPYDEATGTWGVAVMNVQANIPDTVPGQGVMFLLFGDVDISNGGDAMEAFYFSSGVGTAGCQESANGILINTPEGAGMITLVANNVTIDLGSTALLTAQPDDMMTIALTEGNATVTAEGESQTFEGGFQVNIPVNEDLEAVGAPTEPEPIPEEDLEALPDIMAFIEDVDGDATDEVVAGDAIVPQSGSWTSTTVSLTGSEGCPPGMTEMMVPEISTESVDFGGEFDLQTFISLMTVEGTLPGMTYSNPQPNVYVMEYSEQGASLTWTMNLLSETSMQSSFVMDMTDMGVNCVITYDFSMDYNG